MRSMWFSPRAIALHVTILVIVPVFAGLCAWQVDRAISGNTLSWAYVFEWPFFAGYAVYLWWRFVHEPAAGSPEAAAADAAARARAAQAHAARVARARAREARAKGVQTAPASQAASLETQALQAELQPVQAQGVAPAAERTGHEPTDWGRLDPDLGAGGQAPESTQAPAPAPAPAPVDDEDEDEELAAYNRYLADLEASGHRKRW